MARVNSVIIVVDCSIAHAAGSEEAIHPTSKRCRDFLISVLRICHRIGISPAISEEWKRHRSGFSRQWLVSMYARKKVAQIARLEDLELREAIQNAKVPDKSREAMFKDVHLLEAAMNSDSRIASLDETVRKLFSDLAGQFKPVQSICWVNPNIESELTISWLDAGAPVEAARQLASS